MLNIQIHGWKRLKAEKKRSKFERENKEKGFGQDHRAGLQRGPRCSSHPSGPSAQSSWRGTTPHHPCLTQPFLPFQLILLPKRPNIMFFNFNSQFQRLLFGPISEQSIKPIAFSGSIKPCPFQPIGKCVANTPRCFQLPSQPSSLSLAHTVSCQKGHNLNQNLLILFPVTADPARLRPASASPAARLIAKRLLHRWWRQSQLLRQTQLCASARAAAAQREKQLYFSKKLSKAPSTSIHGQDSNLEPGQGSPPAIPALPPPRPGPQV